MTFLLFQGETSICLLINEPPDISNTTCTVTPKEGVALDTKFKIECEGMTDPDPPLTFEFGQMGDPDSPDDVTWSDISKDNIEVRGGGCENSEIYVTDTFSVVKKHLMICGGKGN